MELPTGNFFEVTINSHKLLSSIQQLHERISQQDLTIEQLSKAGSNLQGSLWHKISERLDAFSLEMERERRSNQEELNHLKLIVKDQDKHVDQKIAQFAGNIVQLSKKIEGVQNCIQEDTSLKLSYLERKIQNNLTAQDFQSLLKEDIEKYSLRLQRLADKQVDDVKKLQDKIRNVAFLNQSTQQYPIQDTNHSPDPLSVTTTFLQRKKAKSQTRKRLRTQRFGAIVDQSSEVQEFKDQIQLLEKKINYSKENITRKVETSNYTHDHKAKEILRQIMAKVATISDQYSEKIPQFEQRIVKLNNKCQVVDQYLGILSRKIDKQRLQLNEVAQQIKSIDEKRIDDKALESMKNSIKQIAKQLQEGIEGRLSKDNFQKQKKHIFQRLSRLFNLIDGKSDKGEVKKGLSFLEDKIKDIIIVLAQDRNLTKDSATRRIQAKCLSCDKQLESAPQDNIQNIHKSMRTTATNSLTGRASTSQLRKRIRVLNGSIVGEDTCQ